MKFSLSMLLFPLLNLIMICSSNVIYTLKQCGVISNLIL
ncbi:hypothetical protein SALWKB2_2206 [Snodgrassella alvi wkB2]|nr:hypothetical protein SALWKB2_2206 [Snodgrassella alvi wkB2]